MTNPNMSKANWLKSRDAKPEGAKKSDSMAAGYHSLR